jgi:hypothetical protein
MINKINTTYKIICWIPLAVFFGLLIHIKKLQGWGGLAAASAIKTPIFISLILGIIGLILMVISSKIKKLEYTLIMATLLSASPFLWFAIVFYLPHIF